jgi:hypothetical protein
MKRKHQKTLEQIYNRPISGNIPWTDIVSLLKRWVRTFQKEQGPE